MPDFLNDGVDYDDDGMQMPHLDMDSVDQNGNHHHEYRDYKAEQRRKEILNEAKANIESFRPEGYVKHHIEPVNRREQALQSDDADYLSSDEDAESNDAN